MKNNARKTMAILIVALLCFGSIGFTAMAGGDVPEGYYEIGVDNGSFENDGGVDSIPGYMNETTYNTSLTANFGTYQSASISNASAYTGSKSLLVYDAEDNGSTRVTTDIISASASATYQAEFWANFPSGDYGPAKDGSTLNSYTDTTKTYKLQAGIRFYHRNGAVRSTTVNYVNVVPTAVEGEWVKYTIPATTASGDTTYVKVEFVVPTNAYAKVYVDDLRLFKLGTGTTTVVATNKYNAIALGNSGFEDAVNNEWSYSSETTATTDVGYFTIRKDKRFSGINSLQIVDMSANIVNVASKYYTAKQGDVFKGSYKVFSNTSAGTSTTTDEIIYAKIEFYNAAKAKINTDLYKKSFKSLSQQRWAYFTIDKKEAPANTAFMRVTFYTVGGTKCNVFIDDVVIYSTGESVIEPEPATYSDMTVNNAGFEEELNNWSLTDSNITDISYYEIVDKTVDANAIVHSGNKSLKIVDGSDTDAVMFTTPAYKVQQGGTYEVSGYMYNIQDPETSKGSRALIYLNEYNSAGTQISSSYVGGGSVAGDYTYNMWKEYTLNVTVQPQTKYIRVIVGVSEYWNGLGTYFDDIALKQMDRTEYKYISDVSFKNTDNSPLTAFEADKELKACINITNTTGESMPITLIAGIYNAEGKLQNIALADNSAAVTTSSTLAATLKTPSTIAGSYIKIMVWNNGTLSMEPYYLAETTKLAE